MRSYSHPLESKWFLEALGDRLTPCHTLLAPTTSEMATFSTLVIPRPLHVHYELCESILVPSKESQRAELQNKMGYHGVMVAVYPLMVQILPGIYH